MGGEKESGSARVRHLCDEAIARDAITRTPATDPKSDTAPRCVMSQALSLRARSVGQWSLPKSAQNVLNLQSCVLLLSKNSVAISDVSGTT